jgi:triosephosphate isomerase
MKKLIIANNKMNMVEEEAKVYFTKLVAKANLNNVDVVICPSYTSLPVANFITKESGIKLGAQNVSDEEFGAFTGEVNAEMLKSVGAEYVIVGHSERRNKFKENDKLINKKIKMALKHGLKCIYCVGESLVEKNNGKTEEIIKKQIEEGLKGLYQNELESVIIAYEPVWAIGTGVTATPKDVEFGAVVIRNAIKGLFSEKASSEIQVVYGGSLNDKNFQNILNIKGIDGGLFGGISLNVDAFVYIINNLK